MAARPTEGLTEDVERLLAACGETAGGLGHADAPVVLTEFVDLSCRASRAYSRRVFPAVLLRFVITGHVRVHRKVVARRGLNAATWAAGAAQSNRLFSFTETCLRAGAEAGADDRSQSPAELTAAATRAGLDPDRVEALARGYRARARVVMDLRDFKRLGLVATPALAVQKAGGPQYRVGPLTLDGLSRALAALGRTS